MDRPALTAPVLLVLIALIMVSAGCNDTTTTGTGTTPIITTPAGPLYAEGDIVRNPSSTADNAWLVIGYDGASDTYERALVYLNDEGTWGYRMDERTEHVSRALMEKVNTEIVTNRPPSAIPVKTPAVITAPTNTETIKPAAVTTTATAAKGPTIKKIIPDKGDAGTTVQVTDLVGDNFKNGANVTLSRAGSNEIKATGVRAVTPQSITCTFAIPADAPAGSWDVVVTNPDGQSDRYTNIFSVHRTPGAQSTTYATHAGTVGITYIDPPNTFSSQYSKFTITGSGFRNNAKVILKRTDKPDIEATNVLVSSDTRLECFLNPPAGSYGVWDVRIVNTDGSYGVWYGAFTIS
jgi:hypothetical protein